MINLLAKKLGMSHLYKEDGVLVPLTLIKLYDNCVIDVLVNEEKEFNNILIGYDKVQNVKRVKKPISGVFTKKGLQVHKKIRGSRIKKSANYKTGDILDVNSLLKEGDKISVTGTSVGKGFAGVMKRHNFKGLEASHGVSISHRSHGSTGQCQDPGKVFKGKKMAGQMGNTNITIKNLEILFLNNENNTIAVKGAVPGSANGDIILKIS
jgi:large subunit ribosomal protein L3